MYLKSLTLKGFKSFASATTMKFEPGICAVVGPNGSGKSNVVDALAWVMGEHSAKTLRGGKMEDVIFAGTAQRKPLGRAEVTLTIDNSDGALPISYREVSVTRRMYRDGASEYEVNGSRVRLLDVQELLSDTGIGREMHIIVGQGRLAQILESRPEERRAFIEEAAGVLKHRRRKEKALRKLNSMQANLDRLQDLTKELARQLKPLARQAEAAARAQTVQAELRQAKMQLAAADFVELSSDLQARVGQAETTQRQATEAEQESEIARERVEDLESRLTELTPEADSARDLWFRLSALGERIQATGRIATERASDATVAPFQGQDPEVLERRAEDAAAEEEVCEQALEMARERLEEVRESLVEAEDAAREAEEEHLAQLRAIADRREGVVRLVSAGESAQARLEAAEQEVQRIAEQEAEAAERRVEAENLLAEAAAQLRNRQAEGPELAREFQRAEAEAQAAQSRLNQLRIQERELEREVAAATARIEALSATRQAAATDGGAWLAARHALKPLSEQLEVAAGWQSAVAAALGPAAEALVAEGAAAHVAELIEHSAGTALLVEPARGRTWRLDTRLPAGASWLLDHIVASESISAALTALLVDVVACEDAALASEIVTADPRLRAVDRRGVLWGPGWVYGGAGARRSSVELTGDIDAAIARRDAAAEQLRSLSGVLAGASAEEEQRRSVAAAARAALSEHERGERASQDALTRAQAQVDGVAHRSQRAAAATEAAHARVTALRDELAEINDRLARVAEEPSHEEPSTAERDHCAQALAAARALDTQARVELRSAEERAQAIAGKAERLRRQAAAERAAKQRHERAQASLVAARESAAVVAELATRLYAQLAQSLERAQTRRDAAEAAAAATQAELVRARTQAREVAERAQHDSAAAHRAEVARAQAEVRLSEAAERIVNQLGVAVSDLTAEYAPGPDFDREEALARLKRAERDLRVLGRVNPLALEEYKALEERYTFLSTQLDDVLSARQDLLNVVEEVDETILQLFAEAWRDVEAEFPKVFATLFPGGEGRLVLTEPDNLLTTGIDVEARPPGKKVKRLSLLSGGEKSLTALAMLVAIFRARPSPFYVLDEVEAALDDVNLRRLIALLEELRATSQLIVITHQKPTMDVANVLYGVTMRGDGESRVLSQRMSVVDSLEQS